MIIDKYELVVNDNGSVIARTHDCSDVDYFAGDNQWCKASDVDAMHKDMCHELAIVMNELYDSEEALDELHEHL